MQVFIGKSLYVQKFFTTFAQNFRLYKQMNRKLGIILVTCILAIGLHAETIRVMRFVPVAGAESEVAINSLRKVVFTPDSVVLIAAKDGEATPMYKYDYQSILFAESTTPEAIEQATDLQPQAVKFIRNGQLYIRLDGQVYDILGNKIQ